MTCSNCNGATQVKDSRESGGGFVIRRRRECLGCGYKFTTYEREWVEQEGRESELLRTLVRIIRIASHAVKRRERA